MPNVRYEVSARNNIVLVLGVGLSSAILCGLTTCNTASSCEQAGTCTQTSEAFCGFRNKVSVKSDGILKRDTTTEMQSMLLTGLCSPGDRTQRSPNTGDVVCAPFFPYPSGKNLDIMDPNGTTPAKRACGKWIDAGGPSIMMSHVVRRGSYDNAQWINSMLDAEDASTKDSRVASTNMAKFRAECRRTTLSGPAAVRSAAETAYKYFEDYIDSNAKDRRGFLRSVGFEMGHRCAATVQAGSYLLTTGSFTVYVANGYYFDANALSSALSEFLQPLELQRDADDANREIYKYFVSAELPEPTAEEVYDVLAGAVGQDNFTSDFEKDTLGLLTAALRYYDSNPTKAVAYLKGIAAFCSYSPLSVFSKSSSTSGRTLHAQMKRIRSKKPPASGLGRLREVDDEVTSAGSLFNATTLTLVHAIDDVSSSDSSDHGCLYLMRSVFSDEVEEARFDATVPRELYDRLETLVAVVRDGIRLAAYSEPVHRVLNNASLFADRAANTEVRIVGAPRGTWAGLARPIPRPEIHSSDGMFVMIMKQARASFMDEVVFVGLGDTTSPCDHAPLSSQTAWNAYILRDLDCSVYFLGIMHRPMADAAYDDATLFSRVLHVVAHEMGHVAESVGWSDSELFRILHHYHPDTFTEAFADVVGAVAVLHSGLVTRDNFITLFCGVWCSREPFGWKHPTTTPPTVHPSGNSRCDNLVYTLDEFFPHLGL